MSDVCRSFEDAVAIDREVGTRRYAVDNVRKGGHINPDRARHKQMD